MENYDPDKGGSHGYSLAFTDSDSYASVQNSFTSSNQWPINGMTTSLWVRWVGMRGTRSWCMTVMTANDPNHVQLGLNDVQKENNGIPNLEAFVVQTTTFAPANLKSFTSSWTHVTLTYNLTGISIFYNGTLVGHNPGNGLPLRWTDTSAFFIGGWILQVCVRLIHIFSVFISHHTLLFFLSFSKQVIRIWYLEHNQRNFMDGWMIWRFTIVFCQRKKFQKIGKKLWIQPIRPCFCIIISTMALILQSSKIMARLDRKLICTMDKVSG